MIIQCLKILTPQKIINTSWYVAFESYRNIFYFCVHMLIGRLCFTLFCLSSTNIIIGKVMVGELKVYRGLKICTELMWLKNGLSIYLFIYLSINTKLKIPNMRFFKMLLRVETKLRNNHCKKHCCPF